VQNVNENGARKKSGENEHRSICDREKNPRRGTANGAVRTAGTRSAQRALQLREARSAANSSRGEARNKLQAFVAAPPVSALNSA
jgi:hypothetical protein